jgi:hypothetical protein
MLKTMMASIEFAFIKLVTKSVELVTPVSIVW